MASALGGQPAGLPQIAAMIEREDRRALGVTVEGVAVELLVAAPDRLGTELLRATGAAPYVSALEPLPERPDETAVYAALGIPWCPPELRERPFQGEPPPQRMPARDMTDRVCHALRNPHVSCLSHPTGRLLTRRPENAVDLERVYQVAVEQGVALEVNGLAPRLDLSGEHVRDALQAGARVVCSTDAHSVAGLGNMALSVATARRGWATAAEVLNTRSLADLFAWSSR